MQIAVIAEISACVISAFYYKKIKDSFLKWIPFYLLFVSVGESMAHYYRGLGNAYIYLSIALLSIIFYNDCFYQLLQGKKNIQRFIIVISSILTVTCLYIFMISDAKHNYTYPLVIAMGIELSIIACIYLYHIFLSEDLEILLIKQSGFWMAAGVLLFFSGMCFTFAISPLALKYDLKIFDTYLLQFIPRVLSVVLYSFLSIAVILNKKGNSKSL
jgi:hypothetical protein